MYEKILVPTDGSEGVKPAIHQAIELAKVHDAEIHALFVMDVTGTFGKQLLETSVEHVESELEKKGEEAINVITERAEEVGLSTNGEVREGRAHIAIQKYADNEDIDVIVMGTHGRSGIERSLLGSVTERVIRQSDIPVTVVRRQEE